MKITYDSDVDAAYIYLVDEIRCGEVACTVEAPLQVEPNATARDAVRLNVDFNDDGEILGFEVLLASTCLSSKLLAQAELPVMQPKCRGDLNLPNL